MPQMSHLMLPAVGKAVLALKHSQDRAAAYALAIGRDNRIKPIGNGIPSGRRFSLQSLTMGGIAPHDWHNTWHPVLDHGYHFKCRNTAVAVLSYNYGPVRFSGRCILPPGLDVYQLPVSAYGHGTTAYLYVREGTNVEYDGGRLNLRFHSESIEYA